MKRRFLIPAEIAEEMTQIGVNKANLSALKSLILGFLAGAFIAFASQGTNVAIHTVESAGLARMLSGTLFSTGLMFVLIAGAELFTGNSLMIISCLEKKAKWTAMLKNWLFVYIGNLVGAIVIALLVNASGQFGFSDGLLGGFTIKTAVSKVNMSFDNAFVMGILCNWIVCLAVWISTSARDAAGRILAIFFPIWLFITSGFEHSIANMYYIPAGILAKANPIYVEQAINMGVSAEKIDALSWGQMFSGNLLPVTLGNIVGGCVFVGVFYWFLFVKKDSGKLKK